MEHYSTLKKNARFVGLLYLIWVISGFYGIMYIPSQTFVTGDAAATANKILANEFLFRTGLMNDLISGIVWVLMSVAIYRLFKQVNEYQAKLLVALVIVQVPAGFIMGALNIAALMLFKGQILNTFEPVQRQDLAMLFFKINGYGTIMLEMFWGLWLLPFGQLVYRSRFIPRILGVFLILNGIAYIIHCTAHILFPNYQELVSKFALPFWTLGEISIMLWLLIKGVSSKKALYSEQQDGLP